VQPQNQVHKARQRGQKGGSKQSSQQEEEKKTSQPRGGPRKTHNPSKEEGFTGDKETWFDGKLFI